MEGAGVEATVVVERFIEMHTAATAFTIDGDVIELRDGERVLARGEARYFD